MSDWLEKNNDSQATSWTTDIVMNRVLSFTEYVRENQMTDSYLVSMNDPEAFKVGERAIFKGEAGLKIDFIELLVDGFSIGEVGFGRASGDRKLWELEYTFKGAGKGRRLQVYANGGNNTRTQYIDVLPKEVVKPVEPVEKPSDYKLKIVDSEIRHAVRWEGGLVGLICHYDAGSPSKDPTGLLEWGKEKGYTFWAMTTEGVVHRTTGNNEFGYNVGMERHRDHIGVEISNPGKLRMHNGRWHPWYHWNQETGKFIEGKQPWPEDQVRYFKGSKTQVEGYYAKFTDAQEKALVGLVQYLKNASSSFKIDNVVDHSECMAEKGWYGVKQDVGGSLSMSMPEFREYLKKVIV